MPLVTIPVALHHAAQLLQSGRPVEAETIYREILRSEPDRPEALHGLGVVMHGSGNRTEALSLIDRAIAVDPNSAAFLYNRARILEDLAQTDAAIAALERAVELKPDFLLALYHLGRNCLKRQRIDDAVSAFGQCVRLKNDLAEGWMSLGIAQGIKGNLPAAIEAYNSVLAIQPKNVQALYNLGIARFLQNRLDESIQLFNLALQIQPDSVETLNNMGAALQARGDLPIAAVCYRRILELRPDDAEAMGNLGVTLQNLANIKEAREFFDRAVTLHPENRAIQSNRLYAMHFDPRADASEILRAHREWSDRVFPSPAAPVSHANERSADRRLRIGYVSPDFRNHVVGRNILPLIRDHDRRNFEIFCYSNAAHADGITAQFQAFADGWRDIGNLSDESAAKMIREDGIDILVDLALHMNGNRLGVFAMKPAPVQATFGGYPGTTGLGAIDYRLTDSVLDPEGKYDADYSEKSIRLSKSFWCYDSAAMETAKSPAANELPAIKTGRVTFGCLSNFAKVNDALLQIWAEILASVPGSRLILLCPEGEHRKEIRLPVDFVSFLPREKYLAVYNDIDLGLDTFPYNGHTTSLDSLWMGVPMVTLAGSTAVSRGGASILSNLGLSDFIANSREQYISIAKAAANDLPRLAEIRAGLRDRMMRSPLMDAPGFARDVESAYSRIWREYCTTT
jgi:protein O-GlcNAc transferase